MSGIGVLERAALNDWMHERMRQLAKVANKKELDASRWKALLDDWERTLYHHRKGGGTVPQMPFVEWEEGQLLYGGNNRVSYRLGKQIGSGGYGSVFAAEVLRKGAGETYEVVRRVALKFANRWEEVAGLVREGWIAAAHIGVGDDAPPHAVQTYMVDILRPFNPPDDAGVVRDTRECMRLSAPCLVMRLMDAGSMGLQDLFTAQYQRQDKVGFAPRQIAIWMSQIAHALNCMKGLIHRDLKYENIFIDKNQDAWLLDYGIALPPDPYTRTVIGAKDDSVLGTVGYMSPEQTYISIDIDVRSDIYAMGVMMYELWTLHHPWPMTDEESEKRLYLEYLDRMAQEEPDLQYAEAGHPLTEIIEACLNRRPGLRPQSHEELTELLYPLAKGVTIPRI